MTSALVDPQLAAFWASDPELLRPAPETPARARTREHLALEIAAALLVSVTLVRAALRRRHAEPDEVADVAGEMWRLEITDFLKMLAPVVRRAFAADGVTSALTAEQADGLAAQYALSMGDYFGDSSVAALEAAVQLQVGSGINSRLAWQRAAAAFGLDARDMRGYVNTVILSAERSPQLVITPAAQAIIDKATQARVAVFGTSESWTSLETGRALTWLYLQRLGRLPADAVREWDVAESESTCALCRDLHEQRVALDEPFLINGVRLWAPQAHPGCRCHVKLVVPEIEDLAKAYDPRERRNPKGSEGGGRWARAAAPKPTVPVAERVQDATADAVMAEARAAAQQEIQDVKDEPAKLFTPSGPSRLFGEKPKLFGTGLDLGAGSRLFRPSVVEAKADVFAPGRSKLFATPLFESPGVRSGLFATRQEAQRAARVRRRIIVRRQVGLPPVRRRAPKVTPKDTGRVYFIASDDLNMIHGKAGKHFQVDEDLDFAQMQEDTNYKIRATIDHPWHAISSDFLYQRRKMDPELDRGMVSDAWYHMLEQATPMWHAAIQSPDIYLDQLGVDDLDEIAAMSGLDPVPGEGPLPSAYVKDSIRSEAARLTGGPSFGDTGMAQAFADYVVWQKPEVFGENGRNFAAELEQLRSSGIYLADHPVDQVLAFDTRDSRRRDDRKQLVEPSGHYSTYSRTYSSAIHDFPALQVPPLFIGLEVGYVKAYEPAKNGKPARWYQG